MVFGSLELIILTAPNFVLRRIILRTLLLFALLPIIACSDDDKPTAPTPTLNTTPRTETDSYFYINQWDGSNWVATTSQVNLQTTWRFTSYDGITSGVDNGGTISGGYTIEFTNTSNKLVDGRISKIMLYDSIGITIAEFDVYPDDEFTIMGNGSTKRTGTFRVEVVNLAEAELITAMSMFGGFYYD